MKKAELQSKIESFYESLKAYRELLSKSRDAMVRIVRNGPELEEMRSDLNRTYGALSKYIKKLGNYPMRSDVGGGPYPVYEIGLSADILQRRGPCIDAAIQDLEYILGRLEDMSDDDLDNLLAPKPQIADEGNPHKRYWKMTLNNIWSWIKNHILATVIAGVILAVVLAWLGLN